jgi:two-component system LytT family response regulator
MIRTVIVEDETHARNNLKKILSNQFPQINIVGEGECEASGIQVINQTNPDLVFMDINLSDGSGFSVLEKVSNANFKVIFVTAYNQYAIKAFNYSAIGYVLKPIDTEELKFAIERATQQSVSDERQLINSLLENYTKQDKERKIAISDKDGVTFVNVNDIVRCQSDNNYTEIHLKTGNRLVSSKSLKFYEDLLPKDFFYRVHQSHLVNLNEVARLLKEEGGYLIMNDGSQLEIARRRKDELLQRLANC